MTFKLSDLIKNFAACVKRRFLLLTLKGHGSFIAKTAILINIGLTSSSAKKFTRGMKIQLGLLHKLDYTFVFTCIGEREEFQQKVS
jgi:hypothetical protein